jgi:hypothetical protein
MILNPSKQIKFLCKYIDFNISELATIMFVKRPTIKQELKKTLQGITWAIS